MTHILADVRHSDPRCQINVEQGGRGSCWTFSVNLSVNQGIVRHVFEILLSLIVGVSEGKEKKL